MSDIYKGGELVLHGPVSFEHYGDHAFTSYDVVMALAEHGNKPLTVRLNCPGGSAFDGIAIYNALVRHKSGVHVIVEGLAASAGSLIAMAGKKVSMTAGALMMVHDARSVTIGDMTAHAKEMANLDKLSNEFASIYAARSGQDLVAVREAMKSETWFSPEQAVAAGYADEVLPAASKAFAAFDYRAYAHAPAELKLMAFEKGWTGKQMQASAAAADERADKLQAELDALKASIEGKTNATAYEQARLAAAGGEGAHGLGRPGRPARAPRSGPVNFNDFLP